MFTNLVDEMVTASRDREFQAAIESFAELMRHSSCSELEIARAVSVLRAAFRAYAERTGEEVCSFCGSTEKDVAKLLTAGDSAICDSCIWNAAQEIGLTMTK